MRKEWTTIDKAAWGPGPWVDEPDKVHFVDEATGLDGLMVRHDYSGHWCGYVGVPPGHPLHGKDYNDCYDDCPDLDVHGGLTYSNKCRGDDEATSVCHVPEPGRPHDVWWLGFDCAHLGDLSPGRSMRERALGWEPLSFDMDDTYRDAAYVEAEVRSLAAQLAGCVS